MQEKNITFSNRGQKSWGCHFKLCILNSNKLRVMVFLGTTFFMESTSKTNLEKNNGELIGFYGVMDATSEVNIYRL